MWQIKQKNECEFWLNVLKWILTGSIMTNHDYDILANCWETTQRDLPDNIHGIEFNPVIT